MQLQQIIADNHMQQAVVLSMHLVSSSAQKVPAVGADANDFPSSKGIISMYAKKVFLYSLLLNVFGCSQIPNSEEEIVASSATNPLVEQRSVNSSQQEAVPDDPRYRPIHIAPVATVTVPTGSLFNADNAVELYKLHHNFRIGDMILVKLNEYTESKKSLDYTLDKSTALEIGPVSVSAGPISISEGKVAANHEQESEFDSSANTSQSNELEGDITVYVTDILPNNNLMIAGEKWITLNKGQEYVRFSGEIRIVDITANNTIDSAKVGNARIEYSGKGDMQDNQDPTLIGTLFSVFN